MTARGLAEGLGRVAGFLVAGAVVTGCSSGAANGMNINVEAPRSVNGGLPMRMLVRNLDSATFVAESYPAAAAKVVTPDPTVLKSEVVYPGVNLSVSVTKPEKGELGVYFFFTTPGPEWKVLLSAPFDKTVIIKLGADRIQTP